MKKVLAQIIFLCTALVGLCQAQIGFEPQVLSDSVNSSYSEINPIISPDDSILYFSRLNHPTNNFGQKNSQDVWFCKRLPNGNWGPAEHAGPAINLHRFNAVYAVLDNGNTLLIEGVYNSSGNWVKRGISYIFKAGDTWSAPVEINVKALSRLNRGDSYTAFMDPNKSIVLFSFDKTYRGGKNDIFLSKAKGAKFTKPKKLKASKRSKIEQAPIMDESGDTIFFASNRNVEGRINTKENFDIFYIVAQDAEFKDWSEPQLYSKVNSNSWDSYFRLNAHDDVAYFSSNRGGKDANIYAIRRWDNQPYVEITGAIKDKYKNTVLEEGNDVSIDFKYEEGDSLIAFTPDSLLINKDSMTYSCRVGFGKVYVFEPSVENYNSEPTTIDAKDIKVHTEINADLFVIPLQFAKVTGVILDKEENSPIIESEFKPEIYVNGEKYDSVTIDEAGRYEFNLSLGESYDIEVRSEGYEPVKSVISLEGIESYKELEQNLFVNKLPETGAHLHGSITNAKDNSFIDPSEYEIIVNGNVLTNVNYKDGEYDLKLVLGKNHFVKIHSNHFLPESDTIRLLNETENITVKKDFALVPVEVGQKMKIRNVYFASGKATLLSTSNAALDQLVEFMIENRTVKVEIGGHTDNVGNDLFNKRLSKQRADAVSNYIVSKGISADRISTEGYGEEFPIASNDDEEHRALNRRVEFKITQL